MVSECRVLFSTNNNNNLLHGYRNAHLYNIIMRSTDRPHAVAVAAAQVFQPHIHTAPTIGFSQPPKQPKWYFVHVDFKSGLVTELTRSISLSRNLLITHTPRRDDTAGPGNETAIQSSATRDLSERLELHSRNVFTWMSATLLAGPSSCHGGEIIYLLIQY